MVSLHGITAEFQEVRPQPPVTMVALTMTREEAYGLMKILEKANTGAVYQTLCSLFNGKQAFGQAGMQHTTTNHA